MGPTHAGVPVTEIIEFTGMDGELQQFSTTID
jgi:ribosomal protein S28E/S33